MGVNKVELANGETLVDLTGNTVNPDVLLEGYTATNAQGEQIEGRAIPGGGEKEVEIITGSLDLATLTVSNLSHTYQQILEAIDGNKNIVMRGETILGPSFATPSYVDRTVSKVAFNLLTYLDIGQGLMLYYFRVMVNQNNSVVVTPLTISTVS